MRETWTQRLLHRWWALPEPLRWVLLLALFAGTTAAMLELRWSELPATPYYPVVLLAVALGTEAQGYLVTILAVITSIGLALALHIPADRSQESMDSAVLALVGVAMIVAMRQRRSSARLLKAVTYETGIVRALGNYALTRLSREDMMRAVVRYLANTTDANVAFIALPDQNGQDLVGFVDTDDHRHGPEPVRRPIATSLAGTVYTEGRPRVIPDTAHEPLFAQPNAVVVRSVALVPLKLAGQPIGVLYVGTIVPKGFDQEDVRLLETLARTLSVPLYASRPARADQDRTRADLHEAT